MSTGMFAQGLFLNSFLNPPSLCFDSRLKICAQNSAISPRPEEVRLYGKKSKARQKQEGIGHPKNFSEQKGLKRPSADHQLIPAKC